MADVRWRREIRLTLCGGSVVLRGCEGGRKGGWSGVLGLFRFMVRAVGYAHNFSEVFSVGLDAQTDGDDEVSSECQQQGRGVVVQPDS